MATFGEKVRGSMAALKESSANAAKSAAAATASAAKTVSEASVSAVKSVSDAGSKAGRSVGGAVDAALGSAGVAAGPPPPRVPLVPRRVPGPPLIAAKFPAVAAVPAGAAVPATATVDALSGDVDSAMATVKSAEAPVAERAASLLKATVAFTRRTAASAAAAASQSLRDAATTQEIHAFVAAFPRVAHPSRGNNDVAPGVAPSGALPSGGAEDGSPSGGDSGVSSPVAGRPAGGADGAVLLAVHKCRAMHQGRQTAMGELFVTATHLCFAAAPNIREAIPYERLHGAAAGVALTTTDPTQPYFIGKPAPQVRTSAVIVSARDPSAPAGSGKDGTLQYEFFDFGGLLVRSVAGGSTGVGAGTAVGVDATGNHADACLASIAVAAAAAE